ncbi:hypothetical protein [Ruegeria atlantica]|uniref:hypothetical protein n=1 Tax=Ruegeria atlantica TaxID=81569 RepID=UPI00147C9F69|nr:hypothetical protein [Ruegeria atlantica]
MKEIDLDIFDQVPEEFKKLFGEQMDWANLNVTLQDIGQKSKPLVRDLAKYDRSLTVALLSGLLTVPRYQSHNIRLESLVLLAAIHCSGSKRPRIGQAARWFREIGKSPSVLGEDPAEDVFVSQVTNAEGNFRLIEGLWEASGFNTQRMIDVLDTMPDEGSFFQVKRSVQALLFVSELVCKNSDIERYIIGSDEKFGTLESRHLPPEGDLRDRTLIPITQLEAVGVLPTDLAPFIFRPEQFFDLTTQQVDDNSLISCPIMVFDEENLLVAMPTAISVAIRRYLLEFIHGMDQLPTLDLRLANSFSDAISNTSLLGGPVGAPIFWRDHEQVKFATFGLQFDEGHYASFHLFLPKTELNHSKRFKDVIRDTDGKIAKVLQEEIDNSVNSFRSKDGAKGGLVILVGCGWGPGVATESITFQEEGWHFAHFPASDLIRLSGLPEISLRYLYQLLSAESTLMDEGVNLWNVNGIANLIGWVRSNNGHLVPHASLDGDRISPQRPLQLMPPMNLLREVRAEGDKLYDEHVAIDVKGDLHTLKKFFANSYWYDETKEKVYVSIRALMQAKFLSVYRGAHDIWLRVDCPNATDRDLGYRLWEMCNEWLGRMGYALDSKGLNQNGIEITLAFRDAETPEDLTQKASRVDLESLIEVTFDKTKNKIEITFGRGFLIGFRSSENVAEATIVRTILDAVLSYSNDETSLLRLGELFDEVVPNEHARCFHLFVAQDFGDFLRHDLPKELITIEKIPDAATKIGLGWRGKGVSQDGKVSGKSECCRFLASLVDELLGDVKDALAKFECRPIVHRLLYNTLRAEENSAQWRRTSAAILGLNGNTPNTVAKYVEHNSQCVSASVACRILIEMAICVCPKSGDRNISDIELEHLIAKIALVVRLGGISDAIRFNALKPQLRISPLGDVLVEDDFGNFVVEPMLERVVGDNFVAASAKQAKNYEEAEIVPETESKIDAEFWKIWANEFGFNLDEARYIIEALEDFGLREGSLVLELTEGEFVDNVVSDQVSEAVARAFWTTFLLPSRDNWETIPEGHNIKDIYPWKYGRRLSIVTRPILGMDVDGLEKAVVAPTILRRGFAYVFDGAFNGTLDQDFFNSPKMRNDWWGVASEGHTFNADVAKKLSDQGWLVRQEIKLEEILNAKLDKNYGDVDVLAWNDTDNKVYLMECKDLSAARNYSEIAAQLSDYQGEGKKDKLRKHLDRVRIAKENIAKIAKFCDKSNPEVISCLICSGVVPMQYSKSEALEDTFVGSVDDFLAEAKHVGNIEMHSQD